MFLNYSRSEIYTNLGLMGETEIYVNPYVYTSSRVNLKSFSGKRSRVRETEVYNGVHLNVRSTIRKGNKVYFSSVIARFC